MEDWNWMRSINGSLIMYSTSEKDRVKRKPRDGRLLLYLFHLLFQSIHSLILPIIRSYTFLSLFLMYSIVLFNLIPSVSFLASSSLVFPSFIYSTFHSFFCISNLLLFILSFIYITHSYLYFLSSLFPYPPPPFNFCRGVLFLVDCCIVLSSLPSLFSSLFHLDSLISSRPWISFLLPISLPLSSPLSHYEYLSYLHPTNLSLHPNDVFLS